MVTAAVLAVAQAGVWMVSPPSRTVGDTIEVSREVPIETAGVLVRPGPLEVTPQLEPLEGPWVEYGSGGARVVYLVALFESAPPVAMPPIELVFPDGRVDVLPGGEVEIGLRSVLPEHDSLPPPRGSRGPVARFTTRRDLLIIPPATVLLLTLLWLGVSRRIRPRPVWEDIEPSTVAPSLTRWISAGEPRAVAAVVGSQLRDRVAALVPEAGRGLALDQCLEVLARHRPEWPNRELAEVAHALLRASFAPAVPHDVLALADDADELMRSLSRESEQTEAAEQPRDGEEVA